MTLHKKFIIALALSGSAEIYAATYDMSGGSGFSNSTLAKGDAAVNNDPDLSSGTRNFLKFVRKTAEKACDGTFKEFTSEASCDPYSKGYVDSVNYFISLEKKAGGALVTLKDMTIAKGEIKSGDKAQVTYSPCEGDQENKKDDPNGDKIKDQRFTVVAAMFDPETCDNVKPNKPKDGVLDIDSRNKQECNYYMVCGARPENVSVTRSVASTNSDSAAAPQTPIALVDPPQSLQVTVTNPQSPPIVVDVPQATTDALIMRVNDAIANGGANDYSGLINTGSGLTLDQKLTQPVDN